MPDYAVPADRKTRDPIEWLPPTVHEKLRELEANHARARGAYLASESDHQHARKTWRLKEASLAEVERQFREGRMIQRREARPAKDKYDEAGIPEMRPDHVKKPAKIQEIRRVEVKPDEERLERERRTAAGVKAAYDRADAARIKAAADQTATMGIFSAAWEYLTDLPTGTPILVAPYDTAPPSTEAEDLIQAVEKRREEILNLQETITKVEAAPRTLAEALENANRQVDALITQGSVSVFQVIEKGRALDFPTEEITGHVVVHSQTGFAKVRTPNSTALLAWTFPDAFRKRIEDEIKRQANDDDAIDAGTKAKKIDDARAKLLVVARREESLIERAASMGMTIHRRRDADPRAVLGLSDAMPAPAEAT